MIKNCILKFYEGLSASEQHHIDFDVLMGDVSFSQILDNVLASFDRSLSGDELLLDLKGMCPTKALGLDGFHVIFYQKYWDVIGTDVLEVVLGFLNGSIDI